MARIKIALPEQFSFSCQIAVRITDINYGGHVGNDTILTIVHEARMQFLNSLGFTEMNFGGIGMIMADAAIEFKNELFYGETVITSVVVTDISKIGFDLIYKLEKEKEGNKKIIAIAKTGMICYDYSVKKITAIPEVALKKITS
ncbi:MAG: thioesterase family protein [Chitinophagaceae bacterium]|nr:thioesterase family protein [Chitinophagaceae bacterium]